MQATQFFNCSGPVNNIDHYCVNPIKRLDTNKVWQLILQKKYFMICGPKQSGKTSYLLALASFINSKKETKCLYVNVESVRGAKENLEESIRLILFEISSRARDAFRDDYLEELVSGILATRGPYQALNELLTQWCKRSDKPIVLLMDEFDTLESAVLTSVLSQIRAGYDKRPALFPLSIIFCATHDVIDQQFNVKDASLKISLLGRETLDEMFTSYTESRNIEIEREAIDRIWKHSAGQPWIISAISEEIFNEIVPAKGIRLITAEQVDEAIGNIMVKKGNHLEYIVAQLRDERVKKCLIAILTSESVVENIAESDFTYLQELGLIKMGPRIEISNDLYKKLIPSALFGRISYMINLNDEDFLGKDKSLDTVMLLRSFQSFFRNHKERMVKLLDYGNAGYVLVFQALMHKLNNTTSFVSSEYGIDQGRMVLKLKRLYPELRDSTYIIKLKNLRSLDKYKQMLPFLLAEAQEYMAAGAEDTGELHMIVINTNPEFDWEGRLPYAKKWMANKLVHFWGL